jgi:glycosyltransferase involved in cell wall biosynthesis
MRIGVLMPVYNEEKYISFCLKSLLRQTLRPVQVIICDGESTDNTTQIAAEVLNEDDVPFQIVTERKIPSIGKWNISFAYWRAGQYLSQDLDLVACLEADVVLDKNYYKVLASKFENPRLGLACGILLPPGFPESPFPLRESWKNKVTWIANRVYRYSCWLDLNRAVDLRLLPACDTDHNVLAAIKGWEIAQCRDATSWVLRSVKYFRGMSKGLVNRYTGYPMWWNLYKAIKTLDLALLVGYGYMVVQGESSPLKQVYQQAVTSELRRRVKKLLFSNKTEEK